MAEFMDEVKNHIFRAANFNEVYPVLHWPRRQRRLAIFNSYPPRHAGSPPPGCFPILLSRYDRAYGWDSIQVVGFRVGADFGYRQGFLELYKCAREVFRSQPTRLFLHGFFIFGYCLERWMFDRSGMYCSEPTPFAQSSMWPGGMVNQLISDLVKGYQWMSDAELGLNPLVYRDGRGSRFLIRPDGRPLLCLEPEPLVRPGKVVSQSTTCYRAGTTGGSGEYVVKFSLRTQSRSPEGQMLHLANQRKVKGVAQLVNHLAVDASWNFRSRLTLGEHAEFPHAAGRLPRYVTMSCLVVTPFGRPISQFDDIPELLEAFRDAIKAHQSLYFDSGILHRDISIGNIIIPDVKRQGEPRGVLIDLDLSMEAAHLPATRGEICGTKPFISVDLMRSGEQQQHSCIHDLDSFFFVFLWVVICGDDDPKSGSVLDGWSSGSYDDIATRKAQDISLARFHALMSEFPLRFQCLVGLAYQLRRMVDTPWRYPSCSRLASQIEHRYDGMIGAFQAALDRYTLGRLEGRG